MSEPTRYGEIRSSQPTVSERHPALGRKLDALGQISNAQYNAAKAFLGMSSLFPVDMLHVSLVSRSLDLLDAFAYTFDRWNIAVAAPLVRMQIDNVLRAHLIAVTPDPDELLLHLVADKPLNRLIVPPQLADRLALKPGKKHVHTDALLVKLASAEHHWIDSAYRAASAWVHHSSAHVLTSWTVSGDNRLAGRLPVDVEQFSLEFLEPLLDTAGMASRTLLDYLTMWADAKTRHVATSKDETTTTISGATVGG